MWLLAALLLFLTGFSTAQDAITGPNMVSGQERGSLTVRCRYESHWKNNKKIWYRGADWTTCESLVRTDMEQLVKKDRVSIRDDQTDFIVTVTMEELRISDGGIYWCGIEKIGYDPNFKVNVNIDPGKKNIPEHPDFIVTVTMRELRKSDAGIYWCAIKKPGYDFKFKVNVNIDPAPEISTEITTIVVPIVTSTPSTWANTSNHEQNPTSTITRSLLSSIYFKILVFLELPLFLSMLSAVLWVNRPQRCSGGGEVSLGKVQSSDAANRGETFHAEGK